ncbi:hypothetical protein NUW87_04565 [Corynebacterium pilbarense]|uniref:Integrase catalytic domain-containing protein n=1 Tax=Corynebacterium pilbarense TaxID=1288393 RepID=A0A9Q4NRX0_9CORY|nr:hypothetical protein [Corynebacterium pilbarense]MCZ2220646.1 hypothetical protein [Corynebacterium pilbarense]
MRSCPRRQNHHAVLHGRRDLTRNVPKREGSCRQDRLFDVAHTQVTIYQVFDAASRFDVGTKAFKLPENGSDARTTLKEAFARYRKPHEILSDNSEAFATYHRGRLSATEVRLAEQGVMAIAGFAPTAQGKDERARRTLVQFLDARTPRTFAELEATIDACCQ